MRQLVYYTVTMHISLFPRKYGPHWKIRPDIINFYFHRSLLRWWIHYMGILSECHCSRSVCDSKTTAIDNGLWQQPPVAVRCEDPPRVSYLLEWKHSEKIHGSHRLEFDEQESEIASGNEIAIAIMMWKFFVRSRYWITTLPNTYYTLFLNWLLRCNHSSIIWGWYNHSSAIQ